MVGKTKIQTYSKSMTATKKEGKTFIRMKRNHFMYE